MAALIIHPEDHGWERIETGDMLVRRSHLPEGRLYTRDSWGYEIVAASGVLDTLRIPDIEFPIAPKRLAYRNGEFCSWISVRAVKGKRWDVRARLLEPLDRIEAMFKAARTKAPPKHSHLRLVWSA